MKYPHICVVDTGKSVNPVEIFGKDANRLLEACNRVFDNWLHCYEGCYRSPSRPTLEEVRETCNFLKEDKFAANVVYFEAIAEWRATNPEEVAKEELSRKEWEDYRDKQFRIIYGIARRHGLYLDWHGNGSCSCGDRWTIYKHGESIARIYCL